MRLNEFKNIQEGERLNPDGTVCSPNQIFKQEMWVALKAARLSLRKLHALFKLIPNE